MTASPPTSTSSSAPGTSSTIGSSPAGGHEWVTSGDSQATARTYLDGAVSVDEITLPAAGASGMSVRLYSPSATSGRSAGSAAVTGWSGRLSSAAGRQTALPAGRRRGAQEGRPTRMTYEWDQITATKPAGSRPTPSTASRRGRRTGRCSSTAPPTSRGKSAGPHREGDLRLRLPHRHLARAAPQAALPADRLHRLGRVRERLRGAYPPQRAGQHRRGALCRRPTSPAVPRHDVPRVRRGGGRVGAALVRQPHAPMGRARLCVAGSFPTASASSSPPTTTPACRSCAATAGPSTASEHASWEQAFSTDDGGTWETNWVMRETRVG